MLRERFEDTAQRVPLTMRRSPAARCADLLIVFRPGRSPDDLRLATEVHARRIHFMASLDTWREFGLDWSRRLAGIPLQAAHHWPA